MKKTKLLTSLVALALVVSLGACEVNGGDVNIGGDSSDTSSTESSESTPGGDTTEETPSEPSDSDTDSTPTEPPVTYTYSLEVENGESLTLNYDEALETQQGVELSIKLVTTPSTGEPEKVDASADNLTFTVSDPTVVTVSGLTVLPLKGGETSITVKWSEHDDATATVGVTVNDITVYGPTSWADYFTDEYTQGVLDELFDGVALDDILPFYLEESGLTKCEPQPTLLRFNIEYYPEPSGLTETWVALLLEDGWTETGDESSNQGTTETISFEKDGYTISIVIEWGCWDLYLYPRTTTGGDGDDEDLKAAQSILDVVTQTSYLDWDAFHGESVDDWEETISEYLTIDEDGNAYGYVVSSEDSNTYYYYGGYKCVYNQAGVAQTPGESYLDFEDEIDNYSSPLLSAHSLNLSNVDSYEINELSDGYELVITNGASSNAYGLATEYVYTVDSEFNLIALGQYGPENVASSDLVGSYAEKITYADVEEALAATSFNPADFGLGEGGDEETGEEPSSSAIADLFNAALEEKNYTIVLEITDYQSNETAYDPNGFSPYVQLEPLQDLWCKITYTTDAAVVEYYGSYDELLAGTVMDVEYYLNTDSGLDIFMVYYWYEVDTVYFQWTEPGLTWQDYLGSLFGLEDYFSNFVEGETTTTERGTEVSYTLDNLDEGFLEALINALVDNGNYWAWETHGIEQILLEGENVSYTVTYLEDSGIIEFVFVSDEYTYHDEEHFCYYLEQTTIKVYVLDAGSSSTPSYTLEYGS